MQPNAAMKFAEYVTRILLCEYCQSSEKITSIPEI